MPRATPLPPDERRAALIAATQPLLVRHGRDVSTRQIAAAAGVAEGTIFRVFESKDALVDAVLDDVFDPAPSCAQLAAIDPDLPLRDRLTAAVVILQRRTATVFSIFHALRLAPRPTAHQQQQHRAHDTLITAALAMVLTPDADGLAHTPEVTAQLVRALTFAVTHPMTAGLPHDRPEIIVDLLLNGVLTTSC